MGIILQFCCHIIPLNSPLCFNTELSCVLKEINNTDDDLDDDRVEQMGSDLTLDSWDETRICLMAAPPSLNITEAPPPFWKIPPSYDDDCGNYCEDYNKVRPIKILCFWKFFLHSSHSLGRSLCRFSSWRSFEACEIVSIYFFYIYISGFSSFKIPLVDAQCNGHIWWGK